MIPMSRVSKYDEIIKGASTLESGEYESCHFENCDFAEVDLSEYDFIDCEFVDCNLSNVKLVKTGLKEVQFNHCKMLGIDFSGCKEFLLAMHFTDCQLNFSSFAALKLPNTRFKSWGQCKPNDRIQVKPTN